MIYLFAAFFRLRAAMVFTSMIDNNNCTNFVYILFDEIASIVMQRSI